MRSQHLIRKQILPLFLITLVVALASCQIEKEQAARLPDVDVDVEPGRLPEYDIKGPDVNVGVRERTVTVPKVVVIQEKETVKVPYIDVDLPGVQKKERTITTEVEVPSGGYDVEIQAVYAVENQLWVVSRLEEENPNAPKTTVRVSDRVVLNAPDIPVRHYVIGKPTSSGFNEQYEFINSREQIASILDSGKQLYKK
ncbi:hypothetical protein Riv7116_3688 [Rivularia sp. PCC 7116]|uniref:hypothetical protein n=1 Tax=Rivularia sp. PCC 7116 TaxID=373994 RepID=UPI00029F00F1|nr:hypothetical protein [Rivularia sp. PCC 7116]AFY56136.1 hypothetical protein Riv7116_3688 [Rivularia sp. PCC 7116]